MLISNKYNGYSADGRRIYNFGGGNDGPTYTESKVTNSNIPEYAQPYVENMLGAAQKQVYGADGTSFQPYKAYGGTYDAQGNQTSYDPSKGIAGFQPMQTQAQQGVQGMQVPGQFAQGAQGSMDVAGQANVGGFQNQVGGYMSPYMQNVVDIQKREAGRQSAIQGTQQQAQATQAGAFGGGRDAIMRAERERNLGQQMGDIQAQGSQAAFQGAQQQYNQNMQNQLSAYGQAGALAGQGLQAQQGIYGLQNQYGAQQQALEQSKLNQAQQDYANQQQYPLMQLGSLSNMLRGLPMQASSTNMYQAQPNALTQGIGAAGTMASLYNAYNNPNNPNAPKPMAAGGITSIPRYDVGGQVMSQLQQMDDEALAKEAKESPSQEIRRMATEILKMRQAGMDSAPQMAAAPQMDMAPQPQQDMGMAGGGIIAFADRGKVDEAEAARYKNQSDMYILGAQQAAAERQAQEAAIPAVNDRTPRDPSAYRADVPYAENENLPLGQRITNTLDRIRSRTDPAFVPRSAAAPNDTAAVLNENEFPPASITAAAPKAPTKTGGKFISEAEFNVNRPAAAPKAALATAPKAGPAAAPKAGPAAAPNSIMAAAPKAPPELLDRNAPAYSGPTVAPTAQVDPFTEAKAALAKANTEAGKSKKELYDEDLEAKKALGLDQNEAQQAYMKRVMAQQSNIAADAEQKKYLRLAEFFASWGSTPGDTLVAGMQAVKAKIPDMIADIKEQRKAEAEADKVLYELGQAQRQEKLGNWDKVELRKTKAAEIAAKLQGDLTSAQANFEGQKLIGQRMIDVAGIQKESSKYVADSSKESSRYSADTSAAAQRYASNIQSLATKEAAAGRLSGQQLSALLHATTELGNLSAKLERARVGNKEYEAAVRAESMLAAQLTQDPTNKELLVELTKAQDKLSKYKKNDAEIIIRAQGQVDALAKKAFGSDFTPFTPTTTPKIVDPFAKP